MTIRLICALCHRRYWLKPGAVRREACPACRRGNLKRGSRKGWITKRRRKASRARPALPPLARSVTPEELGTLMGEAESKAARALELALSVARARGIK
jgi:PHP family Zn ribbon phosphoesterase